jgi:2-polyprenyl-3-methyl-5-hydroxy-6-metoxy-1,4-benzoquinol methylase
MTEAAGMDEFLAGKRLYGDEFDLEQITQWWKEEEEGYSSLVTDSARPYEYDYHALNRLMFFDRVDLPHDLRALGLGSALGHELLPILDKLKTVTIIDPSDRFADQHVLKTAGVDYRKPRIDGRLDFADDTFDLITCFGVLHHIANVSTVLAECQRVLKPGGVMFCREPIVTQGDWRKPRPGLTKNERGVPLAIFKQIARDAGFTIADARLFDFSPFGRVMYNLGRPVFRSGFLTRIDQLLTGMFAFNTRYHRPKIAQKFGPASLAMILRKNSG